jgi:thiazole synthase
MSVQVLDNHRAGQPPEAREEPWLTVGKYRFRSRILVGIEQYQSIPLIKQVLQASGADVFITTVDPDGMRSSLLLSDLAEEIPLEAYTWIGTTSFARSADSALRTVEILRRTCGIDVIKLDVRTPDNRPDNAQTIMVAEKLLADGLTVLPFILPDLADAQRLAELGCAAIRIMASPVASGRGIADPRPLQEIIEHSRVPVVIEGGLGTAHHASRAMELGAAAVLVNTALARAASPGLMAAAMRHAVTAGRLAYQSRPELCVA